MGSSMLNIQSLLNPAAVAMHDSDATTTDDSPSQDITPISTPTIASTRPSPLTSFTPIKSPFNHPFPPINTPFNTPQTSSTMSNTPSNIVGVTMQAAAASNAYASASGSGNANASNRNSNGNTNNTTTLIVLYPPHEPVIRPPGMSLAEWTDLNNGHQRLNVLPLSGDPNDPISNSTDTIPYRSTRNPFNAGTGKYDFKVFVYTFNVTTKASGGASSGKRAANAQNHQPTGKTWYVRWDRFDGLTSITNLFKALGYNKTAPSKAISANNGLSDIAWNVTGGKWQSQGYWMPYTCARALALNFCYHIRHALTPIFGTSFVHECLLPTDPSFGNFVIDNAIVQVARAAWVNGSPVNNTAVAVNTGNVPQTHQSAPAAPTAVASITSPPVSPKTVPASVVVGRLDNNLGGMLGPKRRSVARRGGRYKGMPGTENNRARPGMYLDRDGMPTTRRVVFDHQGRRRRARPGHAEPWRKREVERDLVVREDSESDDEDIVIPDALVGGGATEDAVRGAVVGLARLHAHGRGE